MTRAPHPIPYQGSKRRLAALILKHAPVKAEKLIEPFCGSAALTLAAASRSFAKQYFIGDSLDPLAELWTAIIDRPDVVAREYRGLWEAQLEDPASHFLQVREEFNESRDPVRLLYLLARCVKNAVRFSSEGRFNQSADHRRKGMHPDKMERQVAGASALLAGKSEVVSGDYADLLDRASSEDVVYMDPPYQGVSGTSDPRYHEQLKLDRLIENLESLNSRNVPFLLSFDGSCGGKTYGQELPRELRLTRVLVHTGRSSQATLAGRSEETTESVYLSPNLGNGVAEIRTSIVTSDEEQLSLVGLASRASA